MTIRERISAFVSLGDFIRRSLLEKNLEGLFYKAQNANGWFTPENIETALHAIAEKYLEEDKLKSWLSKYDLKERTVPLKIGVVMAGNLPLVGFHDLLCVLITGNKALLKLSSKDEILSKWITEKLIEIEQRFEVQIEIVDKLKDFDAVIATGSNNTARYFEYYFGKYPHIIRKTRNSVAILAGNETGEELTELGKDIFTYFGLGCRNVSKVYVPLDYDFEPLIKALQSYSFVLEHHKYKNNYDYHKSILLLNREEHLDTGFLLLRKQESIYSPVASLHYDNYSGINEVDSEMEREGEMIQCVVSKESAIPGSIPLGKSQQPELWDYADNADTIAFLNAV